MLERKRNESEFEEQQHFDRNDEIIERLHRIEDTLRKIPTVEQLESLCHYI